LLARGLPLTASGTWPTLTVPANISWLFRLTIAADNVFSLSQPINSG
jgi:hypothetical protein